MKNDGVSANIADNDYRAMSGASEHSVTELATALAMMDATLESTTDAILVTDEANYVREFNEKYVKFWGIPPHMMISAHASELGEYGSAPVAQGFRRTAVALPCRGRRLECIRNQRSYRSPIAIHNRMGAR